MVGSLFSNRPFDTISRLSVCCFALLVFLRVFPPLCLCINSAVFSGVEGGGGAAKRDEPRGVDPAVRKFVSNSDFSGGLVSFASDFSGAGLVPRGRGGPSVGFSQTGSCALRVATTVKQI